MKTLLLALLVLSFSSFAQEAQEKPSRIFAKIFGASMQSTYDIDEGLVDMAAMVLMANDCTKDYAFVISYSNDVRNDILPKDEAAAVNMMNPETKKLSDVGVSVVTTLTLLNAAKKAIDDGKVEDALAVKKLLGRACEADMISAMRTQFEGSAAQKGN